MSTVWTPHRAHTSVSTLPADNIWPIKQSLQLIRSNIVIKEKLFYCTFWNQTEADFWVIKQEREWCESDRQESRLKENHPESHSEKDLPPPSRDGVKAAIALSPPASSLCLQIVIFARETFRPIICNNPRCPTNLSISKQKICSTECFLFYAQYVKRTV